MATRPLTEEELRQGVVAFNKTTPGMAQAATEALQAARYPEMQRDNGPTTEPVGDWRGQRLGPTERPPAEAPATSSGPQSRPVVRPGPAPAEVAASTGVPSEVPRETSSAQASKPTDDQPEDMHAFSYLPQVEAMERRAMELGRPEIASSVREHYNRLIDGQVRSMETDWKTKTLPQVQAIQKQLLDHQGKQLPRELAMKARDITLQASNQQRQMFGYVWGLMRNESTKHLGIQYFSESEMLQPGDAIADIIVTDDGMAIGVDESGQIVQMKSGKDFVFPVNALEQMYREIYGSDRKEHAIVPEGAMLVDTRTGATVANNPKDPRDPSGTQENQLSATKQAYNSLAGALGIDLTDMGRMMEGVKPEARDVHTRLMAKAGTLIRQGMPWEQAVDTVMREYQGEQAAAGQGTLDRPRFKDLIDNQRP